MVAHSEWAITSLWQQGLHEEAIDVLLTWISRVYLLRGELVQLEQCYTRATELMNSLQEDQALFAGHTLISIWQADDSAKETTRVGPSF